MVGHLVLLASPRDEKRRVPAVQILLKTSKSESREKDRNRETRKVPSRLFRREGGKGKSSREYAFSSLPQVFLPKYAEPLTHVSVVLMRLFGAKAWYYEFFNIFEFRTLETFQGARNHEVDRIY